jgi:hypothetical protein
MMSAVLDEPLEESTLWKRIRLLQQWYQELSLKLDSLTKTVHDIGKPLETRGPDPDLDEERYTRQEVNLLRGEAFQEGRRAGSNFGGIHKNGNANHAWNALTIATVIAAAAWIRDTLGDHGKTLEAHSAQLARIECQLSPETCRQLQVPHVR